MTLIAGMPERDYRAHPAVANSDLKLMRRSPAHFWAARLDPEREPETDTPAKIMGRALHSLILEPHTFSEKFVYVPDDAPRDLRHFRNAKKPSDDTLASCVWWDAFDAENASRTIITKSDAQTVQKAARSIRSHPELSIYLNGATCEESIFAVDPVTGEEVKIRTDARNKIGGMNVIIDAKSTDDAREAAFQRTAFNFSYFQAAAWYSDVHEWAGLGHVDLYLLAAFERDAPHGLMIYEVQGAEIERGRAEYRRAMALYHHCKLTGEWPAYDSAIRPLQYPKWATTE